MKLAISLAFLFRVVFTESRGETYSGTPTSLQNTFLLLTADTEVLFWYSFSCSGRPKRVLFGISWIFQKLFNVSVVHYLRKSSDVACEELPTFFVFSVWRHFFCYQKSSTIIHVKVLLWGTFVIIWTTFMRVKFLQTFCYISAKIYRTKFTETAYGRPWMCPLQYNLEKIAAP